MRRGGMDGIAQQHHAAVVGELDRVAQQIIQDLPDPQRIALHPVRDRRINASIKLQAFGLSERTVGAQSVFGQLQRAEVLSFNGHLP